MRASVLTAAVALAGGIAAFSTPAAACGSDPYIGEICTYAFDWCPNGFVPADGRTLQVNQYTALFALVGVQYGGDGKTTFGVPDLRGRVVVGTGTGNGLAPVKLAQPFGQQTVTPGAVPVAGGKPPDPVVGVAASQPIPTQPPSLGMTVCIATMGLFPPRP